MKVLFLTNNSITASLANWIKSDGTEVSLTAERISADTFAHYSPDWIISYNYRHIIKSDVIESFPGRILNFHVSLLPWNRGADPNLWSFLDNTPKGVTIHHIDEGVDTGPILLQKELMFDAQIETLESSYARLQEEIQLLFKENWEKIRSGLLSPYPQVTGGTRHFTRDSVKFKEFMGSDFIKVKCSELVSRYANYLELLKR